jgi:RNA polymerase sigma-70 factor (ECF subfamily)
MEGRAMVGNQKLTRSDAELARLAAEGDAAAFDEIYSRYRTLVYSLALRMTGNLADAEDLTQDSFVSVLRRIGSFRGEASFSTWLYRVVVNQVNMHFRRRKSRPEDQTRDGELPEREPSSAGRADSHQLIDRLAIEEAMQRLPPGYWTAFNLYDIERYKHKEIARLLGCSEGTSKSQLHRARHSLRNLLSARSHALQT